MKDALHQPSPESRALVASARVVLDLETTDSLKTALAECSSVDALCGAAISEGMLGHLHKLVVVDGVLEPDTTLAQRLGELQRMASLRSFHQTAILLRSLDHLSSAGIAAMPIKGPVWSHTLYGDIAMRTWSDLDVLVGHEDVRIARKILVDQGFIDGNPYNERIARRSRGGLGQILLSSPELGAHIELHWEVTVGISSRSFGSETVMARARQVELLDRPVPCPSERDQFLITCVQGARDRWDTVEKLLGLGVQVRRIAADEWPSILAEARALGCLRRVCVGVDRVNRVLGGARVPDVDRIMSSDRVGRALARHLERAWSSDDSRAGSRQHLQRLFWGFASEDHLAVGFSHGIRKVFQPGPEDWASYRLPGYLEWLYGPLRPVRLAVKWSRSLVGSRHDDADAAGA